MDDHVDRDSSQTHSMESILKNGKKRTRVSWTEDHYITIKDASGTRRRCSYCSNMWYITTSTGTIAKHLSDKHSISSNTIS